jgi:hypothetical protein
MRVTIGLILTLLFRPAAAMAKTIVVGSCSDAQFPTIQLGVDNASAGDTIDICPGVYPEEIGIIGSGKDGLTLTSRQKQQTLITAPIAQGLTQNAGVVPAGPVAANVLVSGVTGITISNVMIDDSNSRIQPGSGINVVGLFYQNSTGSIRQVTARNPNGGGLDAGIWVDTNSFNGGQSDILSNTISGYGDNFAIIASGENTHVLVNDNTEIGNAPAIFIFNGAIAQIGSNTNPGPTPRRTGLLRDLSR